MNEFTISPVFCQFLLSSNYRKLFTVTDIVLSNAMKSDQNCNFRYLVIAILAFKKKNACQDLEKVVDSYENFHEDSCCTDTVARDINIKHRLQKNMHD